MKLSGPCAIALLAVLLAAGSARALPVAYDGFPDGGPAPGPSQYLTGTPSTNGYDNDSIINQSPSLSPGFTTSGPWAALDPLINTCYHRAEGGGLAYTDSLGKALPTTAGQANLFRTPSGTHHKRAQRPADSSSLTPPSVMYFSGLLHLSAGREGLLSTKWGDKTSIGIGFNNSGNAVITTGVTARGTSAATFAHGATHFLVGKIVEGGGGGNHDAVSLWVNPDDLRSEAANTPTLSNVDLTESYYVAGDVNYTLNSVLVMGDTAAGSSVVFDELRVGTTWHDAAPIAGDLRRDAHFQEDVAPYATYTAPSVTIRSDFPDTNQDDDSDYENIVGRVGSDFMRTLFEFDLSSIAGRVQSVDSVELTLTSRGAGQGSSTIALDLHEYLFPFDETTATWNNPAPGDATPGGTLSTLLASTTFQSNQLGLQGMFGDTQAFRDAVAAALLAPDHTLRLLTKMPVESGSGNYFIRFYDEEFGTLAYHPELSVFFTPVPEPGTLGLLGLGALGLARRRRRASRRP